MYPYGGYKIQTVNQLGNVLAALNQARISFGAMRVYFAALAVVAAREAAERSRGRGARKRVTPRFLLEELGNLAGCPVRRVRKELRSLERAGLLLFSETAVVFTSSTLPGSHELTGALSCGRSPSRPVPLPRPALRYIARSSKVATIKTMLAYCIRGLSISREGQVTGKGTAKASWIAETCGLSLRAVRVARAELIAAGFITRDEGSPQWKLNRHGAYFAINMSFGERSEAVVNKSDLGEHCSAPLKVQKCACSAPPYKDMKTPCGSKNQKTRANDQPGFCEPRKVRKPKLSDIQAEDLRSVSRMLALHAEAVRAGIAQGSEAGRLAFLAAAIHAVRVANRNAAGLFATIVRKQLGHFATQDDEERARRCLQRWQSKQESTVLIPVPPDEGRQLRANETSCGPSPLRASPLLGSLVNVRPVAGQHGLERPQVSMYFAAPMRYFDEQQRRSDTPLAAVNLR